MLPHLSNTILRNGQAKEQSGPCFIDTHSENVQRCSGSMAKGGSKLLCIYIEWTVAHINGHALQIFITTAICHSIILKTWIIWHFPSNITSKDRAVHKWGRSKGQGMQSSRSRKGPQLLQCVFLHLETNELPTGKSHNPGMPCKLLYQT